MSIESCDGGQHAYETDGEPDYAELDTLKIIPLKCIRCGQEAREYWRYLGTHELEEEVES